MVFSGHQGLFFSLLNLSAYFGHRSWYDFPICITSTHCNRFSFGMKAQPTQSVAYRVNEDELHNENIESYQKVAMACPQPDSLWKTPRATPTTMRYSDGFKSN
jgi:hypothetical protein